MKESIFEHVDHFSLVELTRGYRLGDFKYSIKEHEVFLTKHALDHQDLNIYPDEEDNQTKIDIAESHSF